jgi:hypothetical protein
MLTPVCSDEMGMKVGPKWVGANVYQVALDSKLHTTVTSEAKCTQNACDELYKRSTYNNSSRRSGSLLSGCIRIFVVWPRDRPLPDAHVLAVHLSPEFIRVAHPLDI